MSTLKDAIAKRKREALGQAGDISAFIELTLKELTESRIKEAVTEIKQEIDSFVEKLTKTVKKGEPGINGKNYVLTENDKKRIAGLITVPVVEKKVIERTVVKEQPIVTNNTKVEIIEKAVTDKPQVIADKLNTTRNSVEMYVIKDLVSQLDSLKKSIRESKKGGGKAGGGMGNWVHQETAISSATTTITLANRVASNGLAHIARYQGQVLDYGTQYTLINKTITLLFTPDDGTIFSIAYVRT